MTLKVPNDGEVAVLSDLLGLTTPDDLTLKLFTNNITPGNTDTASSYTEMSGQGYAAKTLTMASWGVSSVAGVATAAYAEQTWTFTAGGPTTIYGYYVIGADSVIRYAEKFTTAFVAEFDGDVINVTPQFTLNSLA